MKLQEKKHSQVCVFLADNALVLRHRDRRISLGDGELTQTTQAFKYQTLVSMSKLFFCLDIKDDDEQDDDDNMVLIVSQLIDS